MRGIALGEIAVAKEGMCCATVGATKEIASVRIVEFKLVVKPRACARPRAVRMHARACVPVGATRGAWCGSATHRPCLE